MGKTHLEQLELKALLDKARTQVEVGATYQHYKGADKLYRVQALAFQEADNTLCVIYQALYGEQLIFSRPLSSWLETVEWETHTVPRFTKISSK